MSHGITGGLTIPHIIVFVPNGPAPGHGLVPIERLFNRESIAEEKYDMYTSLFFAISCKDALLSPIPIRAVVVVLLVFVSCIADVLGVVAELHACSKQEIGAEATVLVLAFVIFPLLTSMGDIPVDSISILSLEGGIIPHHDPSGPHWFVPNM